MLMNSAQISPPTITMAKGRCESDPIPCDSGGRQQAERRDQHRHHDGTKPQYGSFHRGIRDGVSLHAQLIDVLQHDDAGLDGDSKQRQEPDARGHAEVGVRKI